VQDSSQPDIQTAAVALWLLLAVVAGVTLTTAHRPAHHDRARDDDAAGAYRQAITTRPL
jgi:hypothetical protein